MKKLIFALILFITQLTYSQDPFITIGKLKLRYDVDSNMLKLGYSGTLTGIGALRLGKELDGQLFKFNPNHFSWSTSTGLNLLGSYDSLAAKQLTIYKDTAFGETQWFKTWNLRRKYFNQIDSMSLKYEYKNTQYNTSAEFYAINKIYILKDKITDVTLITTYDDVESFTIPHDGLWRVSIQLTYEFAHSTALSTAYDSIYATIDIGLDGQNPHGVAKHTYPSGVPAGATGQFSFEFIIKTTGAASITVVALCSNNAGLMILRKIKYIKVIAELIH